MKKNNNVIIVALAFAFLLAALFVIQKISEIPRVDKALKGEWVVDWNSVNLREGPGMEYEILKCLQNGEKVQANGTFVAPFFDMVVSDVEPDSDNVWMYVTAEDGTDGFLISSAVSKSELQFNSELKGEYIVEWQYVNVRATPDIDGKVVTKLSRGAKVTATGYFVNPPYDIPVGGDLPDPDNLWVQVMINGDTAWLCSTAIRTS